AHRSLEKLVMADEFCCYVRPGIGSSIESRYRQIFQGTSFPNLKHVELGLCFPAFFIGSTNQLQAKTLLSTASSVSIVRRCLTPPEATELLASIPNDVDSLSLFLLDFTLTFFETLMVKCPNLRTLSLFADKVSLGEESLGDYLKFHEMRYKSWRLQDLDIWSWEYGVGRTRQWALMKSIAHSIPSIRSFAGQGHMQTELADQ